MKILIAYFSLSGNTACLAKEVDIQIGSSELHEIQLKNPKPLHGFWAIFWYGFKTIFRKKMEILPDELNVKEYDFIVLAMPVWTDNMPPPIRHFIERHYVDLQGKKIGIVATYDGKHQHFFENVKRLLPQANIEATLAVKTGENGWKTHTIEPILDFLTQLTQRNIWVNNM